eukprot:CAMPEP_0180573290 /NCGR_PEP_ID=MMETSP1037_2-20121125/9689_1 /TAXON_ID=632150 /ORGANISM="Azadinium spinosum, Strain 3D9" /LENGTH=145 /DNA_ID=CAMNT_0022590695 /DNA_START=575 /DNA_END=1013 /DNA_ORIENTATION=-
MARVPAIAAAHSACLWLVSSKPTQRPPGAAAMSIRSPPCASLKPDCTTFTTQEAMRAPYWFSPVIGTGGGAAPNLRFEEMPFPSIGVALPRLMFPGKEGPPSLSNVIAIWLVMPTKAKILASAPGSMRGVTTPTLAVEPLAALSA